VQGSRQPNKLPRVMLTIPQIGEPGKRKQLQIKISSKTHASTLT
jgi:hypothetical protein